MAEYAFPPPPVVSIAVTSGESFPVRRIFCVGQNYSEHTREMGGDPDADPPFFFTKPADAIAPNDAVIPYPPATFDFQHEVELVDAFSGGGRDIEPGRVDELIFGYAVGLDMTRRDLQNAAKKEGKPWDMGKGFDHSAPIGDIIPAARFLDPTRGLIELKVNGAVRQTSDLSQLIWSVAETIACLSGLVRLAPGDLIFTGTPAGVAAVQRGDLLEGVVAGVGTVRTRIV
jgi:fumarylpyruvate hydrolase